MTARLAKVEPAKTVAQLRRTPVKKPPSLAITKIPIDELSERIDPNKPLSNKAKLFAKLWAQGESVVSASVRSGLGDGSYAYRLTRYPQVIAIYEAEKKKFEEQNQMSRKKVMDGLLEGIALAKLEGTSMGVIAGWREIGRMCGYYEPIKKKIEVNVTGELIHQRFNSLSDAELLKIISEEVVAPVLEIEMANEGDEDDDPDAI